MLSIFKRPSLARYFTTKVSASPTTCEQALKIGLEELYEKPDGLELQAIQRFTPIEVEARLKQVGIMMSPPIESLQGRRFVVQHSGLSGSRGLGEGGEVYACESPCKCTCAYQSRH